MTMNPNGTYGKCSGRKFNDFELGDQVIMVVSTFSGRIGRKYYVSELNASKETILLSASAMDISDPKFKYRYVKAHEIQLLWLANAK